MVPLFLLIFWLLLLFPDLKVRVYTRFLRIFWSGALVLLRDFKWGASVATGMAEGELEDCGDLVSLTLDDGELVVTDMAVGDLEGFGGLVNVGAFVFFGCLETQGVIISFDPSLIASASRQCSTFERVLRDGYVEAILKVRV